MKRVIDHYRIVVNMRVAEGYMETGIFFIGNDKDAALKIFYELEGNREVSSSSILRLDLIEQTEGVDTIWDSLECSIGEMADNIRTITKETFRLLNLD